MKILASILGMLGKNAAAMARGGAGVPRGTLVSRFAQQHGIYGAAQRITQADIVPGESAKSNATNAASSLASLGKVLPPVVAAFAALPSIAHALSNRFLESQRNLTQYNATIAAAFHQLEVGRIQRDIRRGGATAGTTRGLAESTNRLENALAPIGNLTTNIGNVFADALNEAAIFMLEGIKPAFKALNDAIFEPEKPQPAALQQFLDNRRHEWLDEQKRLREPSLDLNRPDGN